MTATFTVDVSDGDMNLHMTDKTNGKTSKVDLIAVGTSVYARERQCKWRKQPRSDCEPDTVGRRQGPPVRSGIRRTSPTSASRPSTSSKLVHLTAPKTFPYISADGQRGTYDSFDIWVEEDGTPVLAKGKISMVGAYGMEIKGTSELRFSKFGGPIEIVGAEGLTAALGRGRHLPIQGRMTRMASRLRLHFLVVALVVLGLGVAWLEEPRPAEAAPASLPAWTGGVNLYRNGTFTTQKSWLWCTAAGVQIVRNIVDRKTDHTTAGQRRYFDWMRDAQSLRPAAVRRRRRGRLDRRPAPFRRRPLSAGLEPDASIRRFDRP